jgi:oxalate---CoA ligase
MEPTTLAQLFPDSASSEPAIIDEAAALTVSYRALAAEIERVAQTLSRAGFDRGTAVALLLPNGLAFIVLCLALARTGLIAIPLDPSYKAQALRRLLADSDARALVTEAGNAGAASVAADLAIPGWTASIESTGTVRLSTIHGTPRGTAGEPAAEDIALLLHTSGTEGPPKVVPLTHSNVLSSARHVAAHYALTPEDRSLVVLPLFHGHGLIGAALATLASGGALIIPPRFSASHFWSSFREHRASWYTAVPTIHRILLARADGDGAPHCGARFIRSCSSPLAPALLRALEERFGAPVIEAYGITEASHQVASNPLPPLPRKSGSVGFATGTELAILDSRARPLPAHSVGEVAVRGPSVMHGYRNNPAANIAAFADGWLRTGDLGVLDQAGYLTLTGRIKEMINRGGEKISPSEIESALLAHPAVAEAAAFPVPDQKYGEAVEAAVVLKSAADPEQLRAFSRDRLPDFMVPDAIHVLPSLPRNALGKIVRHALGESYAQPAEPVDTLSGSSP